MWSVRNDLESILLNKMKEDLPYYEREPSCEGRVPEGSLHSVLSESHSLGRLMCWHVRKK